MSVITEQSTERCPDVWFDDGNVVLKAEGMLFKVYLGILQAQSPFFSDMFTLPQAEDDLSEKHGDCPLVTMHGDRAADVRVFLKALFDSQFYADVKSIKDVGVVIGVLKIAHKYQVEHLVRRSVPTFTALYPTTLQKWDIRESRRQWAPLRQEFGRALPMFVANIARSTNMDILLPSALFECCSYSFEEILGGVSSPSGVVYVLHPRDQVLVLQARENLAQHARTSVWGFIYCEELLQSVARDLETWTRLHRWVQGETTTGQTTWKSPLAKDFPWTGFFQLTRNHISRFRYTTEREFKNTRNEVWAMLPLAFGVPAWNKMKWEGPRE